MFRLAWPERAALRALVATLPLGTRAFLCGSRVEMGARGGDVDVVVIVPKDFSGILALSVRATLAFRAVCDEKVDVTVLPELHRSHEQEVFFNALSLLPLESVLATPRLDHAALLVPSVEAARCALAPLGFPLSTPVDFPAEGTRECYVGEPGRPGRLLLIEAIADGPYTRARAKRGYGLHHLGLVTTDLDATLNQATRCGWSERHAVTDAEGNSTHWLARRGTAALLEISRGEAEATRPLQAVVSSLELQSVFPDAKSPASIEFYLLGMAEVTFVSPAQGRTRLCIAGEWMSTEDFL